MRYEVRGLSINVDKSDSGKPALVFLHYWGGTARTWKEVVAELKDRFTTVAYDLRETQIHAYDNREKSSNNEVLSFRMPAPVVVEQMVEDSMSGSREATLALRPSQSSKTSRPKPPRSTSRR